MCDISDRTWVATRIAAGSSVTAIAAEADVSRQTVYTWLAQHQLAPATERKKRPAPSRLAAMYRRHRSARAVGEQLGVSSDTARRWLHAAGVDLDGKVLVDVDVDAVRRRRRSGASFELIAREQGVSAATIRRRIAE